MKTTLTTLLLLLCTLTGYSAQTCPSTITHQTGTVVLTWVAYSGPNNLSTVTINGQTFSGSFTASNKKVWQGTGTYIPQTVDTLIYQQTSGVNDTCIQSLINLPVQLISFQAIPSTHGTLLRWATASETNNAGFLIQSSPDAEVWTDISFITGNGTTQLKQNYQFTTMSQNSYFRLKQVDYNGAYEYSNIVYVDANDIKSYEVFDVQGKYMGLYSTLPIGFWIVENRKILVR